MKLIYNSIDNYKNVTNRVISYGAGTQSTAMLLMGLNGELHNKPELAVFSDTHSEPAYVYEYLEIIREFVKKEFDFTIHTASNGSLKEHIMSNFPTAQQRSLWIPPFYMRDDNNKLSQVMRSCTKKYKIDPFRNFVKKELGIGRKSKDNCVEIWMGISLDEMMRVKENPDRTFINRYPLIDARTKRQENINYVKSFGLPEPPRSACTFCPYHSRKDWIDLKNNFPNDFQDAVEVDKKIRKSDRWYGNIYLHKDGDLENVNFLEQSDDQLDLFNNECEGMCGV